jgi:hypothetical protein
MRMTPDVNWRRLLPALVTFLAVGCTGEKRSAADTVQTGSVAPMSTDALIEEIRRIAREADKHPGKPVVFYGTESGEVSAASLEINGEKIEQRSLTYTGDCFHQDLYLFRADRLILSSRSTECAMEGFSGAFGDSTFWGPSGVLKSLALNKPDSGTATISEVTLDSAEIREKQERGRALLARDTLALAKLLGQ